jgi:hypothetical protein
MQGMESSMNLKLFYLLTVTLGLGGFTTQAMEQEVKYRTNAQAEQKIAAAQADVRVNIQATEPKLDKQYKVQVGSITEEFIGHMNHAMRTAILCDGKATQESLKLAQEALRELMNWLPSSSGSYDVQLLAMMTKVHAGFKHIDEQLIECQTEAGAATNENQFIALRQHIERLNFFRTSMFALLEQWNRPMAEIHVISHALTNYLHQLEAAVIQGKKGLRYAASWLKLKARTVIPFNRLTGTRIPVETLGRFGKREDWDLVEQDQIATVRMHIQRIEKIVSALLEQSGFDVKRAASMEPEEIEARQVQRAQDNLIQYAQTWPWTFFDAEDYFTPILSPDRKSEFAAARLILIECKRALEVPVKASVIRECLENIDKSVNVLNRSLMRLKALRVLAHSMHNAEQSGINSIPTPNANLSAEEQKNYYERMNSLRHKERAILAELAEYRRLRADYPIIDDNAWKAVVGAVAQGSSAASGLMDRTAAQIERWNTGIAGSILQAPRYKKLLEELIEKYRTGVEVAGFAQFLHNNLNAWGYQTADVIGFARGLVSKDNQLGKLILWNLQNAPAFEQAVRKLEANEAALNDAAEVLYHVLGFFNERGIHILEIALRWAGPIENILMGAKAIADYAEGQQFAEYLTSKLRAASGGAGNGLRRVGAALDRTALLTHSRWGLTPRNYAEGLQVMADMSNARAVLPEAVTRVAIKSGTFMIPKKDRQEFLADAKERFEERRRQALRLSGQPVNEQELKAQLNEYFPDAGRIDAKQKAEAERVAAAQVHAQPTVESKANAANTIEIKIAAADAKAEAEGKRRVALEDGLGLGGVSSTSAQPSRQATPEVELRGPAANSSTAAEEKASAAQASENGNKFAHTEGAGLGLSSEAESKRTADRQATDEDAEPMPNRSEVADELREEHAARSEVRAQADAKYAAEEPAATQAPEPASLTVPQLQTQQAQLNRESIEAAKLYREKLEEMERASFELKCRVDKNAEREAKAASWGRWHYFYRITHLPYWQKDINKWQKDKTDLTAAVDSLRNQVEKCKKDRLDNIKALNRALKDSVSMASMGIQMSSFNDADLNNHVKRAYAARDNKRMADDLAFLNSEEVRLNRDISNAQKLQNIRWRTYRPTGWFSWAWGKLRGKVTGHDTGELKNLRSLLAYVQYRKQELNVRIKAFRDLLEQDGINLATPVNLTPAQKQELKDLHPELFNDL